MQAVGSPNVVCPAVSSSLGCKVAIYSPLNAWRILHEPSTAQENKRLPSSSIAYFATSVFP